MRWAFLRLTWSIRYALLRRGFVLERFDLPGYMQRIIFKTPWCSVRLHRILRSDLERELHDHPWDFVSIRLWNGYWEVEPVPGGDVCAGPFRSRWRGPGTISLRKAEIPHRVFVAEPVTTLVIAGPKRREWGFHTAAGWVHWTEFEAQRGKIDGSA